MTSGNWRSVIEAIEFGQKVTFRRLNKKGEDKTHTARLLPASTVCPHCGQDWKCRGDKTKMASLLAGVCYHCGQGNLPKVNVSPVKSNGFFGGEPMKVEFARFGNSAGTFITTVDLPSLLAEPKVKS